ncbi:MAG: hypothetical protein ACRBDL_10455 [Alphaproteobacteria bacterium]
MAKNNHENGNVLWIILLAVALLGLLTGIVSRNSSSVDQAGDVEKNRIKAAAMLRYAKSVEAAIQRMMLHGVSENDLDFLAFGPTYDNANCNKDDCDIFNMAGGGIEYKSPSDIVNISGYTSGWNVSTGNRVYQFGCDDADNSCTELLLLASNIPKSVCLQINRIQGITNPGDDAPQQTEIIEGTTYDGSYSTTVNSASIGGTNTTTESPQAAGKSAGCVFEFGGSQDKYHFYHVLIAR